MCFVKELNIRFSPLSLTLMPIRLLDSLVNVTSTGCHVELAMEACSNHFSSDSGVSLESNRWSILMTSEQPGRKENCSVVSLHWSDQINTRPGSVLQELLI